MASILIVTHENERFHPLADALAAGGGHTVNWAVDGKAALAAADTVPPDMMVVDESLADMAGLALVRQLIQVNAWIQCAVASSLDETAFHDLSEGLGVAVHLPLAPSAGDADRVERFLKTMAT